MIILIFPSDRCWGPPRSGPCSAPCSGIRYIRQEVAGDIGPRAAGDSESPRCSRDRCGSCHRDQVHRCEFAAALTGAAKIIPLDSGQRGG